MIAAVNSTLSRKFSRYYRLHLIVFNFLHIILESFKYILIDLSDKESSYVWINIHERRNKVPNKVSLTFYHYDHKCI